MALKYIVRNVQCAERKYLSPHPLNHRKKKKTTQNCIKVYQKAQSILNIYVVNQNYLLRVQQIILQTYDDDDLQLRMN